MIAYIILSYLVSTGLLAAYATSHGPFYRRKTGLILAGGPLWIALGLTAAVCAALLYVGTVVLSVFVGIASLLLEWVFE